MYNDLIGIPFRDSGRDAKTGLDCYGLVMEVYRRNGKELPEYFAPAFDDAAVNAEIDRARPVWERVVGDPPPLSVMAIKFNSHLCNHTGVYIGNGLFIHTRERIGVNIDRIDSPAWKRRIEGYYVYKGR